ncbi:hypothetical protein BJY52DRAFT_1229614 [Lactarius psammicola]|nr:hypothetical protein BJY52DRAFT_1229614 [Lactarius psammicola]
MSLMGRKVTTSLEKLNTESPESGYTDKVRAFDVVHHETTAGDICNGAAVSSDPTFVRGRITNYSSSHRRESPSRGRVKLTKAYSSPTALPPVFLKPLLMRSLFLTQKGTLKGHPYLDRHPLAVEASWLHGNADPYRRYPDPTDLNALTRLWNNMLGQLFVFSEFEGRRSGSRTRRRQIPVADTKGIPQFTTMQALFTQAQHTENFVREVRINQRFHIGPRSSGLTPSTKHQGGQRHQSYLRIAYWIRGFTFWGDVQKFESFQ